MRWIIAIILSVGLAAGAYFGAAMWDEYKVKQAELEHLRVVQKDLEVVTRQYQDQAGSVAKANALWQQIQQVGLEPDKWVTHPLAVSKTLAWDDFSRLILLSTNTLNQEGGYWFKPERMRVVRVHGEAQPGQEEQGPVVIEGGKPKQVELYDASFEGKFLIRKQ
ncbi:MAG: hypothetical protein AB1916_12060 [Thermodesulfobacteriota bacterium]